VKNIYYVIWGIFFLCSCELYDSSFSVEVSGLKPGILVISSFNYYSEYTISSNENVIVKLKKGYLYYITLYENFYGSISRYPIGNIVNSGDEYITLSPHLGILTRSCNALYKKNIDLERIIKLRDELCLDIDPWRYDFIDISSYLLGDISFSSIGKCKFIVLPELSYLNSYVMENRLHCRWYKSIQMFYAIKEGKKIYLEVYEDGTYSIF